MDVAYQLQNTLFEWDKNKAYSNLQKHGITFEEAAEVFFDPFHQTGDALTDDDMQMDDFELKFHKRETERVWIDIPIDTLNSLKRVADKRDMSVQALLKFYIGQELRQDLARLFGDRVLETTEVVLTRHLHSKEEISSIISEIRAEAVQ